ncbi:hypothetical protein KA005_33285, partial [bacterium]|nr:hypothetical protein [bacterium]
MNIEILHDHISTFTREVIDSGFKRDLDDYSSSLPSSQTNIVALREIAGKILTVLDRFYNSDLPDNLKALLPKKGIPTFLEAPHNITLRGLIENKEIQQDVFFNQLTQFIDQLRKQIEQNVNEITKIEDFIAPYLSTDITTRTERNIAMISIVFKEQRTISSFSEFTKTLKAWNRTLPIYHQLLKSEPPEDIEIVAVQNGSIDFSVNLDVNVAMDLAELFKLGFQVFAAYLAYKKMAKPFVDSYHGNRELITLEEKKEKLLLDNIGMAIEREIMAQHKNAMTADKKIDKTSVNKKAKEVTKLVTSHIVKGNDIKLLALPETEEQGDGHEDVPDKREALREQSMLARQQLRLISPTAQQKLLEAYGQNDEEPESAKGTELLTSEK